MLNQTGCDLKLYLLRKDLKRDTNCWIPTIDWCCFYYFLRNSLVALLDALFARIFLDLRYRCAEIFFFIFLGLSLTKPLPPLLPTRLLCLVGTVYKVWNLFRLIQLYYMFNLDSVVLSQGRGVCHSNMVIWRHLFWLSTRIRDKEERPKYLQKSPKSLANTFSDALAILKTMIAGKKTEGETYRMISSIWEWRNDNASGRVTRPIFSLSPIFTKWAWPAPLKIERTGRTPELEIR